MGLKMTDKTHYPTYIARFTTVELYCLQRDNFHEVVSWLGKQCLEIQWSSREDSKCSVTVSHVGGASVCGFNHWVGKTVLGDYFIISDALVNLLFEKQLTIEDLNTDSDLSA